MFNQSPFFQSISSWFNRTFADPEFISLFMTLVISIVLFEFFGHILMPVLISIIIAYLLNSPVKLLTRRGCPHALAVWSIYIIFLGLFIYGMLYLIPMMGRQLVNLIGQIPGIFMAGQVWLAKLKISHPWLVSDGNVEHVLTYFKEQSPKLGQTILHYSWAAVPNMAELILYLVLVPLLVFFFLKDNQKIMLWLHRFLPRRRVLVKRVSLEVYDKIGAYVKGRVIEVFIVAGMASLLFECLGLQYAILLGVLMGLSVIVPYIGAIMVAIPIIGVALTQWGLTAHFWYLVLVFVIMISIDGNILFPLLFAHTMDLHPIVIILAVLIFGGIWGFWGVFFAIPLATLVNAVLRVWPREDSAYNLAKPGPKVDIS
jgi:putative permease